VATLSEVADIRGYDWKFDKIGRLESNLSLFLFTKPSETTHYSPAKPL